MSGEVLGQAHGSDDLGQFRGGGDTQDLHCQAWAAGWILVAPPTRPTGVGSLDGAGQVAVGVLFPAWSKGGVVTAPGAVGVDAGLHGPPVVAGGDDHGDRCRS